MILNSILVHSLREYSINRTFTVDINTLNRIHLITEYLFLAHMDNPAILFGHIQSPVSENRDVTCTYHVSSGYSPHRLDKIILCPTDFTSDLQLLNTWEFVTCHNSGNTDYPYEGTAVFSCEKYGYLVLDHANTPGYQLRYINREGLSVAASAEFAIVLESVESATMGMSYVFLSDELNSPVAELVMGTAGEGDRETAFEEPTSKLEPESPSLNLSNPGFSLFPLNQRDDVTSRADRAAEQVEFLSETLQELSENKNALESRYQQRQLECEELQQQLADLEMKQEENEVLSETLQELRENKNELESRYQQRQLECEELQQQLADLEMKQEENEVLYETLQELSENKNELESRYQRRQLECEELQQQVSELERKQEEDEFLYEGLNKLSGVLCPDGMWVRVEDQIEELVQAATKLASEFDPAVVEALKTENDRLKEEYQSLDAVVKMYTNQLILTNQEQAMTSEKMTQLSKENDLLKSHDSPPMTTKAPRRNSDNHPSYPPRTRPKHVTCIGGPVTESIIMTEPARGNSSRSFAALDFLKNASIHPDTVLCPICDVKFDKKKTNVERTKHVNECIKKIPK